MVTLVESRLDTHEAVCAERYSSIELQFRSTNSRLKRIESLMIAAATAVIGGFGTIILMLIQMRS